MTTVIEGHLHAKGFRFALVVSRFNDLVTDRLRAGAVDTLLRHGADDADLTIVRVPGAFELPGVAHRLAQTGDYDAIIVLGAVIRGATPHFDYIAAAVTRGIAQTSYDSGIPVIYGVLTTNTIEQAIERAGTKSGNKGAEAAVSAMEMADLYKRLSARS